LSLNVGSITTASEKLLETLIGKDGDTGLIKDLKDGFGDVADSIADAIKSLNGMTVTVDTSDPTKLKTTVTFPSNTSSSADGGYTGSWGPEGKIGILHEEEMILTKDETAKFFAHLGIMESILSTLDLYAANQ
jgi:hypothetical protein